METMQSAMGKRSGSVVDDYIRDLLAASPQGRIDESFQDLSSDPRAAQGGSLGAGLFLPSKTDSDTPGYGEVSPYKRTGEMPVFGTVPGGGAARDLQAVIAEAMKQNPVGVEPMNAPPQQGMDDPDTVADPDDPDQEMFMGPESGNEYVARSFPHSDEQFDTPGWIPDPGPGVDERTASRFYSDDVRTVGGSRTTGGSMGGHQLPFRLRGPVNMQMDEQSLIGDLMRRLGF